MNIWHDMDPKRVKKTDFVAIVEIQKGGKCKYELDKETGLLKLDRVLYTSTHYPANYGFIPLTYADDLDPLDVLIICTESIHPMTEVKCYPIGVIKMTDGGWSDEKIIAIPFGEPCYNTYDDLPDLPPHIYNEMMHFFRVYKELEGKHTAVNEIRGRKDAEETIERAIESYKKKFADKKSRE